MQYVIPIIGTINLPESLQLHPEKNRTATGARKSYTNSSGPPPKHVQNLVNNYAARTRPLPLNYFRLKI